MATTNLPRLSIGLPVYNGERFLRFALDSLLEQTFTDFELIISDNASTDSTKVICLEYAARDSRIRYYRNSENIGAAANFNQVFRLARAPFFKWAAADDVISPSFLEKCMAVLEQDPTVALSYTLANRINSSGEIEDTYDYPMRVDAGDAPTRFHDLIMVNHFCVAVFGIFRRDVLAQTPLIAKYVGSDRTLLAETGLRGRMIEIPEYLFHRRDHPQTSGRMFNVYNRLAWFDPARKSKLNLVYWRVGWEYFRSVTQVSMSWHDKLTCYRSVTGWFKVRRHWLVEDLKAAIVMNLPFSRNLAQFARKIQHRHINSRGGI
jgi:glycosyltransferase involved in cell wall biosynthesis